MRIPIVLFTLVIFGWVAAVTFYGPEIARAVNAPLPTHRTK